MDSLRFTLLSQRGAKGIGEMLSAMLYSSIHVLNYRNLCGVAGGVAGEVRIT